MKDIDQAIAELGRLVGLTDLAFDADGNLSLLFDSSMPVNVARIDDKTMELWSPIEEIGDESDPKLLRYLLTANHLGEGTGAARLALQPGDGDFVLCQRLESAGLDAAILETRFTDFIKHAFYWNSEDARKAAAEETTGEGLASSDNDFSVRV